MKTYIYVHLIVAREARLNGGKAIWSVKSRQLTVGHKRTNE